MSRGDPVEFTRRLADGNLQRCGNRVLLEDENGNPVAPGGVVTVIQPNPNLLNANANMQVGDADVGAGNPVPVTQAVHDLLNANANLQVGDVDVSAANPVPVDLTGLTADVVDIVLTPTISAAAIYAAGDALGGRLDFANAVSEAGGTGIVTKVVIVDDDQELAPIGIVFFNQAFAATADNAPFDPSDADLQNCIGHITIAQTDYANFNDNAVATKRDVGFEFVLAAGTMLYAQMVVRATPTYAAVDDLTVKLTIERR